MSAAAPCKFAATSLAAVTNLALPPPPVALPPHLDFVSSGACQGTRVDCCSGWIGRRTWLHATCSAASRNHDSKRAQIETASFTYCHGAEGETDNWVCSSPAASPRGGWLPDILRLVHLGSADLQFAWWAGRAERTGWERSIRIDSCIGKDAERQFYDGPTGGWQSIRFGYSKSACELSDWLCRPNVECLKIHTSGVIECSPSLLLNVHLELKTVTHCFYGIISNKQWEWNTIDRCVRTYNNVDFFDFDYASRVYWWLHVNGFTSSWI